MEIGERVFKEEFGAVLGDGVRAAPFTTFKNCIVGNGVTIEGRKIVTGLIEDSVRVI